MILCSPCLPVRSSCRGLGKDRNGWVSRGVPRRKSPALCFFPERTSCGGRSASDTKSGSSAGSRRRGCGVVVEKAAGPGARGLTNRRHCRVAEGRRQRADWVKRLRAELMAEEGYYRKRKEREVRGFVREGLDLVMGRAANDVKCGGKFSGCLIVAPPQWCSRDLFRVDVHHPSSVTWQATHCLQNNNKSSTLEEYTSAFWLRLQNIQRGSSYTEGAIRDFRIVVEDRPLAPRPGCLIQATVTSTRQTPRLTSRQLAAYIASSRAPDNPARHFASSVSFPSSKMFFTGTLQEALASAVQSNKAVLCFVTGKQLPRGAVASDQYSTNVANLYGR